MRRFALQFSVIAILAAGVLPALAYTLTDAQEARLKKYIPRTFGKLTRREPVAIAGLGDGTVMNRTHDDKSLDVRYGFLGRLAQRLEREFFYTGGVVVLDPENGRVRTMEGYRGPAISVQGLGRENATALQAFQRLTTDAFLYNPDLVILNYGVSDALRDHPRENFEEALDRAIAICRGAEADVIVVGPVATMVSEGPLGLGLERPYANVAREIAAKHGVLFVDPGNRMVGGEGIAPSLEAEESFLGVVARVKRCFDHGAAAEDWVHPNGSTQEAIGDWIHRVLFDGASLERYSISGWSVAAAEGRMRIEFDLTNESPEEQRGYLCTLDGGLWATSTDPYHAFELKAGASAHFSMDYQLRHSPLYQDHYAFERWGGALLPFIPLLISDETETCFDGLSVRQQPIEVKWHTGFQDEVREAFKMGCLVTNTSGGPIEGELEIQWVTQKVLVPFSLKKDESRELQITVELPKRNAVLSIRSALDAIFRIAGEEYRFRREVEAMQNLSLGQRFPLLSAERYLPNKGLALSSTPSADDVHVHAAANEQAIYVIFEIPKTVPLVGGTDRDSLVAELRIDGRSYGQRRTAGFVDALRVRKKGAGDGPGETDPVALAAFGNGYNKRLDASSITSSLKTSADGSRRFTVVIPRTYLHLHEWKLGNPDSLMGFLPGLTVNGPPGADQDERPFVFAAGRLADEDPRSTAVLELSATGTGRWSVRLY